MVCVGMDLQGGVRKVFAKILFSHHPANPFRNAAPIT